MMLLVDDRGVHKATSAEITSNVALPVDDFVVLTSAPDLPRSALFLAEGCGKGAQRALFFGPI